MQRAKRCFLFLALACLASFALQAEVYYPWKDVYIGALEGKAWAGLVLAPHRESVFAFRFKVEKGNEIIDEEDLFFLVSEVGPQSPDGAYARIKVDLSLPFKKGKDTPILIKPAPKSDTLIIEWTRQNEKTVLGKISAPKNIKLHLIHYFPWNFEGKYQFRSDGQIHGRSTGSKTFHYIHWNYPKGELITDPEGKEVELVFSTEKERELYFVDPRGTRCERLFIICERVPADIIPPGCCNGRRYCDFLAAGPRNGIKANGIPYQCFERIIFAAIVISGSSGAIVRFNFKVIGFVRG